MATTTAPTVEQFKEMVRQEWTDEMTVAAWRRWKAPFAVQTAAMKEAIIAAAQIAPGLRVLDIASGTGEPAVAIATAVGPTGHVTATDLGPGMLTVAEEEARANGLTNLTFRQADAHVLPFPDQSFDRVTCRFGAMYFADSPMAFREIHRVLTPGGRAAFVAWGMLDANPFMLSTIGPFFKRIAPPPGAPTPFKFAQSGGGGGGTARRGLCGCGRRDPNDAAAVARPAGGTLAAFLRHRRPIPPPDRWHGGGGAGRSDQ